MKKIDMHKCEQNAKKSQVTQRLRVIELEKDENPYHVRCVPLQIQ